MTRNSSHCFQAQAIANNFEEEQRIVFLQHFSDSYRLCELDGAELGGWRIGNVGNFFEISDIIR